MPSLAAAYALLAAGGPVGLHLVYVGRERQAWVWAATAGLAGLGLARDVVCLPRYVREANSEASELAKVSMEAVDHAERPRVSWQKAAVMLFMAIYVGTTLARCFADDLAARVFGLDGCRGISVAVAYAVGTAFGAWIAGNVGWDRVKLGYALSGAALGSVLVFAVTAFTLGVESSAAALSGELGDDVVARVSAEFPLAAQWLPAVCAVLAAHAKGSRQWDRELLAEAHEEEEAAIAEVLASEAAAKVSKLPTTQANTEAVQRRSRASRGETRRRRKASGRCGLCGGLLRVYLSVAAFCALLCLAMYESGTFVVPVDETVQEDVRPQTIRVKSIVDDWVGRHRQDFAMAYDIAGLIWEDIQTQGLRQTLLDIQAEVPAYAKREALDTLGLPHDATMAQARLRFREISVQYHPDRLKRREGLTKDDLQRASERYEHMVAAYELLKRIL